MTTVKSITHRSVVISHIPEGFTEPWDYHVDITLRGEINWAPGNSFLKLEMTVSELQYLEECVERLSDAMMF